MAPAAEQLRQLFQPHSLPQSIQARLLRQWLENEGLWKNPAKKTRSNSLVHRSSTSSPSGTVVTARPCLRIRISILADLISSTSSSRGGAWLQIRNLLIFVMVLHAVVLKRIDWKEFSYKSKFPFPEYSRNWKIYFTRVFELHENYENSNSSKLLDPEYSSIQALEENSNSCL